MPGYIWHIDLASGIGREVYRDDLDPEAITIGLGIVNRILANPGDTIALPRMPGMSIVGRAGGRCMTAAVTAEARLVQTVGIAATERCGAQTWRSLHATVHGGLPAQPRAPWCATLTAPNYTAIVTDSPGLAIMMPALGSVLAWAWLDHIGGRHADTLS